MTKIRKARYWATIVYPESAPDSWRETLIETGLGIAISPLHDMDTEDDGSEEIKKPHWHVILCWDGPTTYSVAKEVSDSVNAVNPKLLNNVKGYYRYLTHQDNPEKYQYKKSEIQHLGGFDPQEYVGHTKSEIEVFKREVIGIIREKNILEYADLVELLEDGDREELADVARNNTMFFRAYTSSRRHRLTH